MMTNGCRVLSRVESQQLMPGQAQIARSLHTSLLLFGFFTCRTRDSMAS